MNFDTEKKINPPVAKVKPEEIKYLDEIYIDDYAWLKDKKNPEVISYLEEENNYTRQMLLHTEEFQEELYKELVSRIKETDETVPEKIDNYYYYSRTEEGKQYRIYCRKEKSLDSEEKILIDLNELAKGQEYLSLGIYKVSPDHKYLAYSLDTDGSECYTLFIKDLATDELFPDKILNTCTTGEWLNDNKTILYATLDDAKRPFKAYKHVLGTDPASDPMLYHEGDEAFYLNISKTSSDSYIIMTMVSKTTSESYLMSADEPEDSLKLIEPRIKDVEYYFEHHEDIFYIVTNCDDAMNFKIMTTPVDNTGKAFWKDFIPNRDNVRIEYIHVFKNYLVVFERENGLRNIRVKRDEVDYCVEFPEPVYTFEPGNNRVYDTNILRFTYNSLTTPDTVYDLNMDTKVWEFKKRYEVLGGYNPDEYESERIFAKAGDGTLIPISIVYKKGIVKDGSNPLYLYGYGSYEVSIDPCFSSKRLSLLNRGFIYAIAHIRGGGDMGRKWYEDGKYLKKKNTFTDFIASAEHLIKEKYTSKEKLVIMGGSAGGLLMGAVTNMRPDLFRAVVSHVPFVDVVNTMMDPSLPLTVIEYDEWGDPNVKENFDYIKSYSPYDNIEAKEFPDMLVTAGLNDPRVGYWEPAKYVAKMRTLKKDKNILLLKTNMGAGHGGASGRYDHLKEVSLEYGFILDLFGLKS